MPGTAEGWTAAPFAAAGSNCRSGGALQPQFAAFNPSNNQELIGAHAAQTTGGTVQPADAVAHCSMRPAYSNLAVGCFSNSALMQAQRTRSGRFDREAVGQLALQEQLQGVTQTF
jgi:hypothetical protein